jgi:hypothetical protein
MYINMDFSGRYKGSKLLYINGWKYVNVFLTWKVEYYFPPVLWHFINLEFHPFLCSWLFIHITLYWYTISMLITKYFPNFLHSFLYSSTWPVPGTVILLIQKVHLPVLQLCEFIYSSAIEVRQHLWMILFHSQHCQGIYISLTHCSWRNDLTVFSKERLFQTWQLSFVVVILNRSTVSE